MPLHCQGKQTHSHYFAEAGLHTVWCTNTLNTMCWKMLITAKFINSAETGVSRGWLAIMAVTTLETFIYLNESVSQWRMDAKRPELFEWQCLIYRKKDNNKTHEWSILFFRSMHGSGGRSTPIVCWSKVLECENNLLKEKVWHSKI